MAGPESHPLVTELALRAVIRGCRRLSPPRCWHDLSSLSAGLQEHSTATQSRRAKGSIIYTRHYITEPEKYCSRHHAYIMARFYYSDHLFVNIIYTLCWATRALPDEDGEEQGWPRREHFDSRDCGAGGAGPVRSASPRGGF